MIKTMFESIQTEAANSFSQITQSSFFRYSLIFWGISWLCGLMFLYYFYGLTSKLRNLPPELKKRYSPVTNAPEKWNVLVFILMSPFMLPRFAFFMLISAMLAIFVRVIMIGSEENRPATGSRYLLIKGIGRRMIRTGLFVASFLTVEDKSVDLDYSYWLGDGYKEAQMMVAQRPPIIICNHMSWSEILAFLSLPEFPAFIAAMFVKGYPFFGTIAQAIGSFFVERESASSRGETLNLLKERVHEIQKGNYSQLAIFPEGFTTNGTELCRFKRGAFTSLSPIQPMFLEYYTPFCCAAFDMIPALQHLILMMYQPVCSRIRFTRMPTLIPTEYMFNKFAHFGNTREEIYAEVARDIYSHFFKLPKSPLTMLERDQFYNYIYDIPSKTPINTTPSKSTAGATGILKKCE